MATRVALLLIVSAVLAIAAAYGTTLVLGSAAAFVAPALAYGIGASMTGMFMLGAARNGALRSWLVVVFVAVFLVITGTFWVVLALPANEGAAGILLLGVPRRTALILLGVGALPMLLLPIAYALAFDHDLLDDDEMQRLRNAELQGSLADGERL